MFEPKRVGWLFVFVLACSTRSRAPQAEAKAEHDARRLDANALYDVPLVRIDGSQTTLGAYRGKVLLVVNTASKCGYTPQYRDLERLHRTYEARGFSVLGFPSNDFGAQEPGQNSEIATFCQKNFGVTFPLFEKNAVTGANAQPLFVRLAAAHGAPEWNFTKYLVGRGGRAVASFPSNVTPQELDAPIRKELDAAP
ncbi:MAG: glutathione peroxidase [Polyangiaceae bacterium]